MSQTELLTLGEDIEPKYLEAQANECGAQAFSFWDDQVCSCLCWELEKNQEAQTWFRHALLLVKKGCDAVFL